ncbi:MAG: hypothetical protein QMC80_09085 [Thermoplasmatales archaeon]|nr:hypothetical protein [Thermoplasmatales archaeon]
MFMLIPHIWVDDVTLVPSGFEENLDFNVVLKRLTTLMPWVEWKGEHHIYYLPDDDPGMEEALKKAKWKDAPKGILSSKPVMNYITDVLRFETNI